MNNLIIIILAYLAGSVNFSILLFRLLGKGDPRARFSGNAGVTNVKRQAGLFWAVVVLLLDLGRALTVCWLSVQTADMIPVSWAGFALILGNSYPCFHQFRGGKGVAGFLGFTMLLAPWAAALSCLAWVLVYGIIRIPFIASFVMVAVLAGGTVMACEYDPMAVAGSLATAAFIFHNHEKNVAALIGKADS